MIKAVLFDIDGTLLDTFEFVFSAVRFTLDKHNLTVSEKMIMKAAGKPLVEYYRYVLPGEDFELLAQTHRDFQENKHHLAKPFQNVEEILKSLKKEKYKLAGVSNRSKKSLIKSLKISKLHKYFDVIIGADDIKNPKPHPEPFLKALKFLKVSKNQAIVVGDTENDVLSARAAGIKCVAVTYGWIGKKIKKSKPDFVIDKIEELKSIL